MIVIIMVITITTTKINIKNTKRRVVGNTNTNRSSIFLEVYKYNKYELINY